MDDTPRQRTSDLEICHVTEFTDPGTKNTYTLLIGICRNMRVATFITRDSDGTYALESIPSELLDTEQLSILRTELWCQFGAELIVLRPRTSPSALGT